MHLISPLILVFPSQKIWRVSLIRRSKSSFTPAECFVVDILTSTKRIKWHKEVSAHAFFYFYKTVNNEVEFYVKMFVVHSLHWERIKIAFLELTIIETFTGPDICLLKRMRRFGNQINRGKEPVRLFGKTNIDGGPARAGRNRVIKIQRQIQLPGRPSAMESVMDNK